MNQTKALSHLLREIREPIITRYRLGLVVHQLYCSKTVNGQSVRLGKEYASSTEFNRSVALLEDAGILESHPSFRNRVYRLIGRNEDSVEEIACSVDPFSYVSHLSAMEYHGLTNRMPTKLFLSSPNSARWRTEADRRMEKDLGDDLGVYRDGGLPRLERLNIERINRTEVHRFNSVHWGAYKNIRGKVMRVSTLGRTFLDMLRNPELCGGMHHVIEVFENEGKTYLKPIVSEIDQNGGPIDKVRAGYILDELLGVDNDVVQTWERYSARGGSRKLDPSEEYMPKWSDKWCLSLNV